MVFWMNAPPLWARRHRSITRLPDGTHDCTLRVTVSVPESSLRIMTPSPGADR